MGLDPARIAPIKLVIFDVDGVLTDGRIVINDKGVESKFFNVRDGHGLKLMQRAGLQAAFLTGRQSRVVDLRAAELGVKLVYQGVKNKIEVYEQILAEQSLTDTQIAFAGDDLVDLPVMRRVGLALAPIDAIDEVKAVAHYICGLEGGRGAAREMVEFILKSQGRWDKVTARYY
ncbi:MAG: HAD-IIIA family hydrolase [Thermodesulfobacteriota bacterium]|nr:HAD-IIIA family hydrolase [Thermodesulfobacteriota bacterium]